MSARHGMRPCIIVILSILIGWLTLAVGPGGMASARADDVTDARQLVEISRMAFETFLSDAELSPTCGPFFRKPRPCSSIRRSCD